MMTGCVLNCISRHITWYLTSDDRWSCIQGVLPGTAPICLQEEEKKKEYSLPLVMSRCVRKTFQFPIASDSHQINPSFVLRPPSSVNRFVFIIKVVAQWYNVCRLAVRETRLWQVNKYDPIEFATTGGDAHDRTPV